MKLLWYCWVQVFREVAKNCRRKVRSRRGRNSADRSWMLATSRYRIIIIKKTHAYTLLRTHTYKKDRKDGVSFGVFGFLYLRFLLLLLFWKECGGVYKTGRRRIGWAAPSLGARKEMLTSSLSFRLFFHLHFPSSSPLFIPFAVFSGGLRHVLWHGLSCRRFIRASARVLFPLSTLYFPRKTLVVIVIIDCIVKQNELISNNFTSV